MSWSDAVPILGIASAGVQTIFTALQFMSELQTVRENGAKRPQRRWLAMVFLFVATWVALALGYYDRHYFHPIGRAHAESLNGVNSRLEITRVEPTFPLGDGRLFINVYLINKGAFPAIGMSHDGFILASNGQLSEDTLGPFFLMMQERLRYATPQLNQEI